MKWWVLGLMLLFSSTSHAGGGVSGFNPNYPLLGPGPLFNLSSDAAWTNASAHVAWAIAVPLIGKEIGGEEGKQIAGWSWIALSLITEAFFHAPKPMYASYPSEVRADTISRIAPTLIVLTW